MTSIYLTTVLLAQEPIAGTIFDITFLAICSLVVLAVAGLVVCYHWLKKRDRWSTFDKDSNTIKRLSLVMKTGHLRVWIYDKATRCYYQVSDGDGKNEVFNPVEMARLYDLDDFEIFRTAVFEMLEGKLGSKNLIMRSRKNDCEEQHIYEVSLSVASSDKHGNATHLLSIFRDVTEETKRIRDVNELLLRYQTVFDTSLLDMIYYDAHGVLRDLNEKACQTFGVPNRQMATDGSLLLKNNPFFNNIDYEKLENTRTSGIINFSELTDPVYRLEEFGVRGKMYYDSTINPIHNAKGELEGIFMSGCDITEMVESFHRQQQGARKLALISKDIERYIQNINYALRVSDVRLVNYYPQQYILEISDNVGQGQLRLSQLRCIRLGTPRFRRTISSVLNRMDHLSNHQISVNIETEIRDKQGRQIWLLFNMVPMLDAQGNVERYFGLCRNMTDMVETEQRLAIETKKAQETEQLKQAFLTNMSYEIRTPLNNVIGYAELFEAEHDVADEAFFAEQIKTSSDQLLALINDILFLSRLDANMEEYNYEDFDFALSFEEYCHVGWMNAQPGVKTIVENPFSSLVVHIDEANVGQVIRRLCSLSAIYTHSGYIRARCDYHGGRLTISIEDTGIGLPDEVIPHVFDRFGGDQSNSLQETGLTLPICQSVVQQMGGTIEFYSKEGKGSTVWITIPCEAKVIEKNLDIPNSKEQHPS